MPVQSILIPISNFSYKQALDWLHEHGYKFLKVHKTQNYYRFRQVSPSNQYNYYVVSLPNGIKLVSY